MKKEYSNSVITRYNNKFNIAIPATGLWVFGYGSLMWDPGFPYCEIQRARIFGFHRRLCLWSVRYRGTARDPGLVLGLAPSGSCCGVAFRIAEKNVEVAVEYLFDREMTNDAYHPIMKSTFLKNGSTVDALTFTSKPNHPQYAPKMTHRKIISIAKKAKGPRGTNREYIINTVKHLDTLGIRETELHTIAGRL